MLRTCHATEPRLWLKIVSIVALVLSANISLAQVSTGNKHLKPAPETASRKLIEEFGGWLLVTSDSDWESKWAAPADKVPNFTEASNVTRGEPIFILIFFANPKLDGSGKASVSCDLDLIRPDGKVSTEQKNVVCFRGTINGDLRNMYLSEPVIGFVGDSNDPPGKWLVRVVLRDDIRKVRMSLETSYILW